MMPICKCRPRQVSKNYRPNSNLRLLQPRKRQQKNHLPLKLLRSSSSRNQQPKKTRPSKLKKPLKLSSNSLLQMHQQLSQKAKMRVRHSLLKSRKTTVVPPQQINNDC